MRSGDEWLSAGIATGRQARRERNLLTLMESMTQAYLDTMKKVATAEGLNMTAAMAMGYWQHHVDLALFLSNLDATEKAYVRGDLLASDIPDASYDAVRQVLVTAQESQWSVYETLAQLNLALDLNTGSVSPQAKPLATITAASFWNGLAETGSKWISKVRRTVRTTSTGLDGYMTLGALRITGIPYKRWVTRHDDDVRPSHAAMDGRTVPVDEMFIVNGSALSHPGDRAGSYEETVNCRCILVGVLKGE